VARSTPELLTTQRRALPVVEATAPIRALNRSAIDLYEPVIRISPGTVLPCLILEYAFFYSIDTTRAATQQSTSGALLKLEQRIRSASSRSVTFQPTRRMSAGG